MSTAVSAILTDVGYDLKLSTSGASTRQAELISYMNRIIRNGITPMLLRLGSDYGMKEWTSTEVSAYVRRYSLPSDFLSFQVLYCVKEAHSGDLVSVASGSSMVLDSDASSSDDNYNGYPFRITSGSADDEQTTISDYTGSTRAVTLSPALSTTPSADDSFVIFEPPEGGDELRQVPIGKLYGDYAAVTGTPEAYALDLESYVVLGGIPNDSDMVLYGLYFYLPSGLTASTDMLPYHAVFDELVRSYTSQIAMNRDEYNVQVEAAIMGSIQADVVSLIGHRVKHKAYPSQPKICGSRD